MRKRRLELGKSRLSHICKGLFLWSPYVHWQEGSLWWLHHTQWEQRPKYYFADVVSASLMKSIFWTNCRESTWPSVPHKVSMTCILTALEGQTNTEKCILLAQCSLSVPPARLPMQVWRRKRQGLATAFKQVTQLYSAGHGKAVFSNVYILASHLGSYLKCRFWSSWSLRVLEILHSYQIAKGWWHWSQARS